VNVPQKFKVTVWQQFPAAPPCGSAARGHPLLRLGTGKCEVKSGAASGVGRGPQSAAVRLND
jgi:hypothetical protein